MGSGSKPNIQASVTGSIQPESTGQLTDIYSSASSWTERTLKRLLDGNLSGSSRGTRILSLEGMPFPGLTSSRRNRKVMVQALHHYKRAGGERNRSAQQKKPNRSKKLIHRKLFPILGRILLSRGQDDRRKKVHGSRKSSISTCG